MIIVDVQRAGPSTGMPTKTEQADLLLAMYGRHGESPLPIVSASTPSECFTAALEAARIAVRYRTPVILLSDTFIANSSEPWSIPDVESLPEIDPAFASPNGQDFLPYSRDEKLARPWAIPGTPGSGPSDRRARTAGRHREHQLRRGQPRADDQAPTGEGRRHRRRHPAARRRRSGRGDAELLVLGWGSSLGTITAAVASGRGPMDGRSRRPICAT